jgi:hypothetical protein
MSTVNVQTLKDAEAKRQFLLVDTTNSLITILDAPKIWLTQPEILFHTGYRIAGTPSNIIAALNSLNLPSDVIDQIIHTAISSSNYQTNPFYQTEVQNYRLWKRSAVKANIMAPGASLFDLMLALDPNLQKTRPNKYDQRSQIKPTTGVKSSTRRTSIYDKILSLEPGKILDVSGLKENGTGARVDKAPGARSKKQGVPGLPIVSADFDHYLLAVRMIPDGEQRYATELQQMSDIFGVSYQPSVPSSPQFISNQSEPVTQQNVQLTTFQLPEDWFVKPIAEENQVIESVRGFTKKKREIPTAQRKEEAYFKRLGISPSSIPSSFTEVDQDEAEYEDDD